MAVVLFSVDIYVCLYAVNLSMTPVDFIVEMPNATDSKFGKHVSRDIPDMTP